MLAIQATHSHESWHLQPSSFSPSGTSSYIFQWQHSFPGIFREAVTTACPAILSKQSCPSLWLLTTGIIPEPLTLGTQGVRTLARRTFRIPYLVGLPKFLSPLMFRRIVEGLFHVGSSGSFWWNVMIYRLCWSLSAGSLCLSGLQPPLPGIVLRKL